MESFFWDATGLIVIQNARVFQLLMSQITCFQQSHEMLFLAD